MWQDIIISEGVKDDINTMNALVENTPRDTRGEGAQKWTSTDEEGGNLRSHATLRQIHGSFVHLIGIARNLPYSFPVALRWQHLIDAHFPMASNSLVDMHFIRRQVSGGDQIGSDEECLQGISSTSNSGAQQKGPSPHASDRKKFCGVLCFNTLLASNVAMMNKMASFNMDINYVVKAISDYCFRVILCNFDKMIFPEDSKSASRFLESLQCRAVAHTLVQRVTQCLIMTNDEHEAQVMAMQLSTWNALHMSMIPKMVLNLVERLIRLDSLFVIVTICEELSVPFVPIDYLLDFFSGKEIPEIHHLAIKNFIQSCLQNHTFQPRIAKTGLMNPQANISMYVSSSCLSQRQGADVYDAPESSFRFVPNNAAAGNRLGIPSADSVISTAAFKLYTKYKLRLQNGLCKYPESFFHGMQALLEIFDFRRFFGDMRIFFDAFAIMEHALKTTTGFDGMRQVEKTPSPFMRVDTYLLNSNQVCVSFHLPQLLLLYSMMGIPRLDAGVLHNFSQTVVRHLFNKIPR